MEDHRNGIMLPPDTSGQSLSQGRQVPIGSLNDEPGIQRPTLESVIFRATKAAAVWNRNEDDLRATTTLLQWRDNCRDEIRDEILTEITGVTANDMLLNAWTNTFDDATDDELAALRATVSGERCNVDCAVTIACELLFLAINEGIRFEPEGNRANTLIRAAMRYLDDIGEFVNFIDGWTVADGGIS